MITGKSKAVFGIYKTRLDVEHAVDELKSMGFRHQDVSVLMPEKGNTEAFAHKKQQKEILEAGEEPERVHHLARQGTEKSGKHA